MTLSNAPNPQEPELADLKGVRILVVEDCWHIGTALKSQLRALGADVAGPVATTDEAERLIAEQTPAESSTSIWRRRVGARLDDRLKRSRRPRDRSGYDVVPLAPGKAAAILQKPVVEAQLLAALCPATAQKTTQ